MRNHILRIAATGQEAIKVNDYGVGEIAARYAVKPEEKKAEAGSPDAAKKTQKDREEDGKKLGEAAKATQK